MQQYMKNEKLRMSRESLLILHRVIRVLVGYTQRQQMDTYYMAVAGGRCRTRPRRKRVVQSRVGSINSARVNYNQRSRSLCFPLLQTSTPRRRLSFLSLAAP